MDKDWFLPHLHADVEWWYFTGFLNNKLGFEVTVFMSGGSNVYFPFLRPFLAHFALTDLENKQFIFNEWTKITNLQSFSNSGGLLNLSHIGGVSVLSNGTDYMINAESVNYSFSLLLKPEKKIIPHGKDGIIDMGTGFSYYYTIPAMRATGIMRKGSKFFDVKGSAWHDHQFGKFTVRGVAWDWLSLRLEDNTQIMAFLLKNKKNGKIWKYLTISMPDESIKTTTDFDLKETGEGKYPENLHIAFPEGEFAVSSMMPGQIIHSKIPSVPEYAEMLSSVSGTLSGKPLKGYAYVEIVR